MFGAYMVYAWMNYERIRNDPAYREKVELRKFEDKKRECAKKGQTAVRNGGLCLEGCGSVCATPASDVGKSCYQKSDCLGECEYAEAVDAEGYQLGKCTKYVEGHVGKDCWNPLQVKTKQAPTGVCM